MSSELPGQAFLMTMPSRMFARRLGRVDRVLEALEDVLPADHEHRVDPALEQRRERLADDAVALVLEPVDLDREVADVVEVAQARHRLARSGAPPACRIRASCCACSIGASMRYSAEEVGDLLDEVDDVVDRRGERVDVLAVDRRDERRVQPLDDVVRDAVALLLADDDVARELAVIGPLVAACARAARPHGRCWSRPPRTGRRTRAPWGRRAATGGPWRPSVCKRAC